MNLSDLPEKKKQIQAKGWFLTYPQCSLEKETALRELETHGSIVEYVIAQEDHKDGAKHLHAFVKYERKVTLNPTKFDIGDYHGNYQVAKCWKAVERYCKKGGNFISSINVDNARMKKAKRNAELAAMDVVEAVDTGAISFLQTKSFIQCSELYKLNKQKMEDTEKVNYWIYGSPGIGKSQWARRNFPKAFNKPQNKWWDGYTGQEHVIMEDVDTNALGHYLKIWGDNYSFYGETKGGTIPINYKQMIVTSNYLISDLWKDNPTMAEAIARRFKTYTVEGDYENGYKLAALQGYNKY